MKDPNEQPDNHSEKNNQGKNTKPVLPLDELMLRMAMQDDDRPTAERAFSNIYDRFEPYLRNKCYSLLFKIRRYNETDLDLLVSNTLFLLFQNANKLLHIDAVTTENQKEAVLKAWLLKVASHEAEKMNKANEGYNSTISLTDDFSFYAESLQATYDEEEVPSSVEMQIFTEVLNECSEREQEIILTYYDHLEGRKHLPPDEIKILCDKFQILPDNLNHIKFRTFKRIRQKSLERMEAKSPGYRLSE
jgi:DNA-directed RNA polymerase specialized sigma24 family protein